MDMVQQMDRIGQVPANMATAAVEMMDDSAAGWALIRQLDAKFAAMPAEFAAALDDVEAGVSYCPAVDWAAVEREEWGD